MKKLQKLIRSNTMRNIIKLWDRPMIEPLYVWVSVSDLIFCATTEIQVENKYKTNKRKRFQLKNVYRLDSQKQE